MGFVELLGDTLHTKEGAQPTETKLAGKVVGLYFSAHWCPPCRGFTPRLAQIYTDLVSQGKAFEIVFVSSDKDESSFNEYYSEMPWLAVPFDNRDIKGKLSSKFGVRGIPTLVLLDEEGNLLTTEGREVVAGNPAGFPWKPKSVEELLGEELTGKDGPVPRSAIQGKKLALYFSAHWCPPCRAFTPQLVKTYNDMKAAGRDDIEFIFVSSDRDEASFNEYFGEMPWLALPFARRDDKEALSRRFNVEGIPTLITLDENLTIVNKNARGSAMDDPKGLNFPWHPKPLEDLSKTVESNGFDVNEKPALIALTSGLDATQQAAISAAMEEVALEEKKGDPSVIFFVAPTVSGPVPQVLRMAKLNADFSPGLLLLDIPDNGGFYTTKPGSLDAASIRKFVVDYKAKKLTRSQMSSA